MLSTCLKLEAQKKFPSQQSLLPIHTCQSNKAKVQICATTDPDTDSLQAFQRKHWNGPDQQWKKSVLGTRSPLFKKTMQLLGDQLGMCMNEQSGFKWKLRSSG
jgi:hypothetical protein